MLHQAICIPTYLAISVYRFPGDSFENQILLNGERSVQIDIRRASQFENKFRLNFCETSGKSFLNPNTGWSPKIATIHSDHLVLYLPISLESKISMDVCQLLSSFPPLLHQHILLMQIAKSNVKYTKVSSQLYPIVVNL